MSKAIIRMQNCAFCISIGIEGPHDHWLRSKSSDSYKITCPVLINTECKLCGKKGHTKKFCKKNIDNVSEKKIKVINNLDIQNTNKSFTKIKSKWSVLELYDNSSESDTDTCTEEETIIPKYTLWADIVEHNDNRLPKIPWLN